MKPLPREEPEQAPTSWWIKISRDDFTKYVQDEQGPRMAKSTLGRRKGRAISTTEIDR